MRNHQQSYNQAEQNRLAQTEDPAKALFNVDFPQHFRKLSQKLENIVSQTAKNFNENAVRKQLISKDQFQKEKFLQEKKEIINRYVDKQQVLLKENIYGSQSMFQLHKHLNGKAKKMDQKATSIAKKSQSIAKKLKEKRLAIQIIKFEQMVKNKKIEIPQNKNYNRAVKQFQSVKEGIKRLEQILKKKQEKYQKQQKVKLF